ncbi:MAG: ATP-binding protein [Myxococcales bacterium]|nr:ATP-binding protein [Myxococcales bacterium]
MARSDSDRRPAAAAWRERLLQGLLTTASVLLTLGAPVILVQTDTHSGAGLALAALIYIPVVTATFARKMPYRARALVFLVAVGLLPVMGFVRVGFQVGPGVGCALIVVTAGLLLGRWALFVAFAVTLGAILAIGALHVSQAGALLAHGALDPLRYSNWVRVSVAYALFTGVLVTAVTFVVAHVERALAERTEALSRLRAEQDQRRETETALDDAHHTIEQMQRLEAVGRLAGGVAHDFNNALLVILGWADLLRERKPTPEQERPLQEIVTAANRAAGLTQQLLAIGRKAVTVPAVVRPTTLMDELEGLLTRVVPEDIRVTKEVEPGLAPVFADSGQLHQVLLNLCLNARDAMPDGGELTLSARSHDPPESAHGAEPGAPWVALVVRDTGTGMDAETRRRAFEPFFTTKGAQAPAWACPPPTASFSRAAAS